MENKQSFGKYFDDQRDRLEKALQNNFWRRPQKQAFGQGIKAIKATILWTKAFAKQACGKGLTKNNPSAKCIRKQSFGVGFKSTQSFKM